MFPSNKEVMCFITETGRMICTQASFVKEIVAMSLKQGKLYVHLLR